MANVLNAMGEPQHPLWKPKFIQAAFAQVTSTLALFTGHLEPGGYVTVTTLILGTFTAGSVVENNAVVKAKAGS